MSLSGYFAAAGSDSGVLFENQIRLSRMRIAKGRCVFKMPFGVELGAGTGGRTIGMGFSVTDGLRQKFTQ